MKKIFKYPLRAERRTFVMMPKGARILDVQNQREIPTLWAEVDPEREEEERAFYLVATGGEALGDPFLGTLQFADGDLVFHVYEAK